jgi:hypothetical protein
MRIASFPLAAVAAALLAFGTSARADTVDFTGYSNGSVAVNYALSAPNTVKTGSANAGGFATILNSGPSFATWCVDLYQTISFPDPMYTDYTVKSASLHTFANAHAAADLGHLFADHHLINSAITSAAFQIAVWEIAYETGPGYFVNNGSAKFTGSGADTITALNTAQSWLGSLGSGSVALNVLESPTHQDVIYAPIPEPETYALMLAGLGVVGMVARKRRQTGRFA